jgi:hypothetical protein
MGATAERIAGSAVRFPDGRVLNVGSSHLDAVDIAEEVGLHPTDSEWAAAEMGFVTNRVDPATRQVRFVGRIEALALTRAGGQFAGGRAADEGLHSADVNEFFPLPIAATTGSGESVPGAQR